jgi:hypothetical protein
MEAALAFVDGMSDRQLKQDLRIGGDKLLKEDFNQAAKAAVGPPARPRKVTTAPTGTQSPNQPNAAGRTTGMLTVCERRSPQRGLPAET